MHSLRLQYVRPFPTHLKIPPQASTPSTSMPVRHNSSDYVRVDATLAKRNSLAFFKIPSTISATFLASSPVWLSASPSPSSLNGPASQSSFNSRVNLRSSSAHWTYSAVLASIIVNQQDPVPRRWSQPPSAEHELLRPPWTRHPLQVWWQA